MLPVGPPPRGGKAMAGPPAAVRGCIAGLGFANWTVAVAQLCWSGGTAEAHHGAGALAVRDPQDRLSDQPPVEGIGVCFRAVAELDVDHFPVAVPLAPADDSLALGMVRGQ